ncbi:hypothetical protein [Pseudoroseicyclus sp. CXY001]|uniref:hypothetical protein n=1 Tax=Pseudoroseicyclus sp. CXY001 TaxID=3242492 RepID=UPI0035711418
MQASMRAVEVAQELGVSKARISQLTSAGTLDGCHTGEGQSRRYDLGKVAKVLGKKLDAGQMLGNGRGTKVALDRITSEGRGNPGKEVPPGPSRDGPLSPTDSDRYQLARTQETEERARKLRRENLAEEGTYLLKREVERQVARQLGKEVAEFEAMLREAARAIADQLGVDFKAARAILLGAWREHRGARAGILSAAADAASMTVDERQADS